MSPALVNLAVVIGLLCGLGSLLTGAARGVPIWTVLFRGAIVVSISTIIVMAFFRYFNVVLYRFLAEKLKEHHAREVGADEGEETAES